MSVQYDVLADLRVQGDSQAISKFHNVASAADRAGDSFAGVGMGLAGLAGTMNGIIDGAAKMGIAIAGGAALAAGAAGVSLIKKGLLGVNAVMEETTIGFATMFTMFGTANDMTSGLAMSKELIEGIRKDAAALPGEFGDFVLMAKMMTGPLAGMGKGIADVRRVTSETVVTAAALGVEYQQAAREMNMLMMGHAGGHNVLGNLMGIHKDTQIERKGGSHVAFNKASEEERLAFVEKMMAKTTPALELYKHSWAGMTSTLVDAGKQFLGNATIGLFGRMKDSLWRIVGDGGLLERFQGKISHLSDMVSIYLGNSWLKVEGFVEHLPEALDRVKEKWGEIRDQIAGVGHMLHEAFTKAWPMIEKVGGFLGTALEHPAGTLKTIAGLRVGGAVAGMAPGALGMASSIKNLIGSGAGGAAQLEDSVAKGVGSGIKNVAELGMKAGVDRETDMAMHVAGGGGLFDGPTGMATAAGAGGAGEGVAAAATASLALPIAAALAVVGAMAVAIFDNTLGAADTAKVAVMDLWDSFSALGPLIEQGGILRDVIGGIGAFAVKLAVLQFGPLEGAMQLLGGATDRLNAGWITLKEYMGFMAPQMEEVGTEALAAQEKTRKVAEVFDYLAIAATAVFSPLAAVYGLLKKMGVVSDNEDPNFQINNGPKVTDGPAWSSMVIGPTGGGGSVGTAGEPNKHAPKAPTVDARGSKFEIKIDAKNENPDRIVRRVFDGIGRAVTRPLTSSYGAPKAY